ncbi:MAG: hypothetical protein QOJ83_1018 [Frankiales bacterium]|nr:hypothetical protein [Frankiales bacterium]MDX6222807.1 hypothetical protein [Frankiales bacterium]
MPGPASDLTLHGSRTFEPPYDDEAGGVTSQELTHGSLALAMPLSRVETEPPALRLLAGGARTSPQPRRKPRTAKKAKPVPPAEPEAEVEVDAIFAAQRTSTRELPSAKVFGGRLVQALSEATAGERPLAQLSPYLSRAVYHRLERHFAGTVRGTGSVGQDNRANVRSVRVCEPSDGVAELAAVVRRGGRMAAIALRLEGVDGRWQCTALQIG